MGQMRDESLLLQIPKVVTRRRLARAVGAPLAIASVAAGATGGALLTGNAGAAVAALAWSAGALLVMRPDEERLAASLRAATAALRAFLARRADVRRSTLSLQFLASVNPLNDEHGWPTLVLLGGLPRGGWSLLAVPPLLASMSLFLAGAFLVAPLPDLTAAILLLAFGGIALLLGLDAYASLLRGTLVPLAPEAGRGLTDTLIVLAVLDVSHPGLATGGDALTGTPGSPDSAR